MAIFSHFHRVAFTAVSYIKCGIANTTSSSNRRSSALDRSVRRCSRILYPAARRKWRRFTRGGPGCTKYAGTTLVPQSVVAMKLTYRVLGYVHVCIFLNCPEYNMILTINSRYIQSFWPKYYLK